MANKQKILIVDDDENIAELISLYMTKECFETKIVYDGESALREVNSFAPDLILLDLMLPGIDGYQVCREVRQKSQTPIIMLSAKGEVFDKVLGLELGADDYLEKPFDTKELIARVKAVLRRYNKAEQTITAGDVVVDVEARRVTKAGRPVVLTNKEFGLLMLFVKNKNVALFRETLYEKVWEGEYFGDSRTLDLHVQRLRRKLGWEHNLVAVYKVGYRLEV